MSRKWTLEKILACEEIKFGTLLTFNHGRYLVNGKINEMLSFFKENHGLIGCSDAYEYIPSMQFFKPDGTEILPPKDKKKIKDGFWVRVYPHGFGQVTYKDKEEAMDFGDSAIACEYFEREVEMEE